MSDSFFLYIRQLELIAFFSGYPLLYTIVLFIFENKPVKNNFKSNIFSLLPLAYALAGTLYLGLQLKNLYPVYSFKNIQLTLQQSWLIGWAVLSVFFWLPVLRKKTVVSLMHSLVFFFFLIRDFFLQWRASGTDNNILKNDMKLYADSLLLNLAAFALIVFLSFLFSHYKKR